jgi:hypothetical protein
VTDTPKSTTVPALEGSKLAARIGDHIEYYYVDSEPILKVRVPVTA